MTVKRLSTAICFLFCALSVQVSHASEALRRGLHDFRYQIFVGGLEVAELKSRYTVRDTAYEISADLYGVGFLQSLFGIEGAFSGSGEIDSQDFIAEKFTSKGNWRGKKTRGLVTFNAGQVESFEYSPKKSGFKIDQYPEDVLENSVDPATMGLVFAHQLAALENCDYSASIFTGRHRLDIDITDEGIQPLPENDIVGQPENVRLCTASATKIRPTGKPKDTKPIQVKIYMILPEPPYLPYPILLEGNYKDINAKAWMVEQSYTPS